MKLKAAVALVLAHFFIAPLVLAQTNRTSAGSSHPKTPAEIANVRTDGLVTGLTLTPDQRAKIYPILLEQEKQWAAVKIGGNSGNKFFELRNAAYAKLRPILTPEQNAQLDKIVAGRKPGPTVTNAQAIARPALGQPAQAPRR